MLSVGSSAPPHNSGEGDHCYLYTADEETQALMKLLVKDGAGEWGSWKETRVAGGNSQSFTCSGLGLFPLSCQSDKHLSEGPRNSRENETKLPSLSQTLA